MKLPQYDIWSETSNYYGEPSSALTIDECYNKDGQWIKKDELISWLQNHLREGVSLSLYTDLMYELQGE
jgi:hypothetical protein